MVLKNHEFELDLFDRDQARRHLVLQVAIANQLPANSAGKFQPQVNSRSVRLRCALLFNHRLCSAVHTEPSLTVGLLTLRTKDKFDIVTRLLILGDPKAPKLLADLEKTETSDDAKRYAYAAKAGIGTAENKAGLFRGP